MTNYDMLLAINDIAKKNIELLETSGNIDKIGKCITFVDDLSLWISKCDEFSDYLLVKKSQTEFTNSIFMCTQGFYKEAITTIRQCLEHMLFAIMLSTSDYHYRQWRAGQYDMSWAQIMDANSGVFGKQFISLYNTDLGEDKSIELIAIAKNVYRECSEFVHGNFEKLKILVDTLTYNETMFQMYINYFSSIQYVLSMALFIRFRDILNNRDVLRELEHVLIENLGSLPEIQDLYATESEG